MYPSLYDPREESPVDSWLPNAAVASADILSTLSESTYSPSHEVNSTTPFDDPSHLTARHVRSLHTPGSPSTNQHSAIVPLSGASCFTQPPSIRTQHTIGCSSSCFPLSFIKCHRDALSKALSSATTATTPSKLPAQRHSGSCHTVSEVCVVFGLSKPRHGIRMGVSRRRSCICAVTGNKSYGSNARFVYFYWDPRRSF